MNYFDKLTAKVKHLREKYPSRPRKAAASMLMWSVKNLFLKTDKSIFKDSVLHIAIGVYGGMGDMFFAVRYVDALSRYLKQKLIVCTENKTLAYAQTIFGNLTSVESVVCGNDAQCDIKIQVVRFPQIVFCDFDRLQTVGGDKIKSYVQSLIDLQSYIPHVLTNDYLGRCYTQVKGLRREDQADIDGILKLTDLSLNIPAADLQIEKPFITVQTGSGMHFKGIEHETRQWAVEKYEQLVELLKQEYPRFKIVQIGADYHPRIQGTDLDLRGKTSIPEMFGLLKNAALHIQQEGGLAIARHYLCGKPSVVLFGPTDEKFVGFPENLNLRAAGFDCCCEWLTKDWHKKCLKTGSYAACMQTLSAQTVFEKIKASRILEDIK